MDVASIVVLLILAFAAGGALGSYLEARRWVRFGREIADHLDRVDAFLERERVVLTAAEIARSAEATGSW